MASVEQEAASPHIWRGREGDPAGLRSGRPVVWLRSPQAHVSCQKRPVSIADIEEARARLERFRPALRALFPESHWDGNIQSALLDYPSTVGLANTPLVKADHALPLTGSIKARGGVYELLCRIEEIAQAEGILVPGGDYAGIADPEARAVLARHCMAVASTGNLGFSIGLVSRAFGLQAKVFMSREAKAWKKDRLIRLGVEVVELDCDYNETVDRGRAIARDAGAIFIDDTTSRDLLIGYAVAADEAIAQLSARGIAPTVAHPLVVYLPCGVGGAPGGVTFGLKHRLGDAVVCVFVEPIESACMLAALARGEGRSVSVYDLGLSNRTVADGLAVAVASELVLEVAGDLIDAVVALPDAAMTQWVGRAWHEAGLRLEPSAAAALGAIEPFLAARPDYADATHIAWTTGGSLLPDSEFEPLLTDWTAAQTIGQ